MAELEVGGVRLHYEVRGSGRPILLLHGFSSSYRGTWERTGWVDMLLARGFETIGLDARGHGASDKPRDPAAYASEILAADAIALLDELELERVDLFGSIRGSSGPCSRS